MARALRVEFPGAIYHVAVRMLGDARAQLFRCDNDRTRLLAQLEERLEEHEVRLFAFCLMRNHYHLVLETPRSNLGKFMHALKTAYSNYYNLRYHRHGHLFDGRYKAKLVEGDEYLLVLSRYVHLNPVWVGAMKTKPQEDRLACLNAYRWSSYQSYVGRSKAFAFVESLPILAGMPGRRRERVKRYGEFVEQGITERDSDLLTAMDASSRCIGTEGFRKWVDCLYQELAEKRERPEDVSFRKVLVCLAPDVVMQTISEELGVSEDKFSVQKQGSVLRGIAGSMLCRYAGLTQRDVALKLGVRTGAAISLQISRLRTRMGNDKKLAGQIQKIESKLDEIRRREVNK